MAIEQLSVFVENTQGSLAKVLEILSGANVNLRALSIADSSDFGVLRIIADDTASALGALRSAGAVVTVTEVLAIGIPDEPGALARPLRILADGGVSVEYIYAFVAKKVNTAFVAIRVDDGTRAAGMLRDAGLRVLDSPDETDL